jgi:hypothetical protein
MATLEKGRRVPFHILRSYPFGSQSSSYYRDCPDCLMNRATTFFQHFKKKKRFTYLSALEAVILRASKTARIT